MQLIERVESGVCMNCWLNEVESQIVHSHE